MATLKDLIDPIYSACMDLGVHATAVLAGIDAPTAPHSDERLDAALRTVLALPDPGTAVQATRRLDSALEQLDAVKAAQQHAVGLRAVPGPGLRAELQAALESDQEWQRARAVLLLGRMQQGSLTQVGPSQGVRRASACTEAIAWSSWRMRQGHVHGYKGSFPW